MKTKGFYISLMAGAICIVAVAAICLNTFGKNDIKENKRVIQMTEAILGRR